MLKLLEAKVKKLFGVPEQPSASKSNELNLVDQIKLVASEKNLLKTSYAEARQGWFKDNGDFTDKFFEEYQLWEMMGTIGQITGISVDGRFDREQDVKNVKDAFNAYGESYPEVDERFVLSLSTNTTDKPIGGNGENTEVVFVITPYDESVTMDDIADCTSRFNVFLEAYNARYVEVVEQ